MAHEASMGQKSKKGYLQTENNDPDNQEVSNYLVRLFFIFSVLLQQFSFSYLIS